MQEQPNLWTCYPTAVSILTGIPVAELLEVIGHDGSRVVKEGDWNREAFVYDEMALALLSKGWALVKFAAALANADGSARTAYRHYSVYLRMLKRLGLNAVVVVQEPGREHAMALFTADDRLYDPLTGEQVTLGEDGPPVICFEALVPMRTVFREFL